MTQENSDFINKWEKILEGVELQRVELKYIRKMRLNLQKRKRHTINIENMWRKGMTEEQIQKQIVIEFETYGDLIRDVEFVLDIPTLSKVVQPETDAILNKHKL